MADFTLVLGNKAYSSWSLRAWLAAQQTGAAFEEIVIPLDRPDTRAAMRPRCPAGRVPVLEADGLRVWDSMAIVEYLHERYPGAGLWPDEPAARAVARAAAAEMHAGFPTLRGRLPMDLKRAPARPGSRPAPDGPLGAEIARIAALWADCRVRLGGAGDYLFGEFGAADAFYAPVVTRFVTYGVALEGPAADYRDAVMAWPALRQWTAAAEAEPWVIENP
jgi:glutathione S-transferase